MNLLNTYLLTLFILFSNSGISQDLKRGTIKVKKPGPAKYIISSKTSVKRIPQIRIFRVRAFNYNFKEYFPKEYDSELYPLMLNYSGLILTDENKQYSGDQIISYEYEIFKTQVLCLKGTASSVNLNYPIRELSKMMNGSSVWIKNLVYKDKNGVLHRNEIGEFKIEKVK